MALNEKMELYGAFRSSMLAYFEKHGRKGERVKKSTASHRMAMELVKDFPPVWTSDIDTDGADILLKRDGTPMLCILWSSTYLTEKEKEKARRYHTERKPVLTLAFSMLEEKDYILVYRFEEDYVDYLHIDKGDFSERTLKRCLIEENRDRSGQLLLDIKGKKSKRKKASSETENKALY